MRSQPISENESWKIEKGWEKNAASNRSFKIKKKKKEREAVHILDRIERACKEYE